LEATARKWLHPYANAATRENVEGFLVAIGVAMAIRTFSRRPSKTPTGPMQPTLYGVPSEALSRPSAAKGPGSPGSLAAPPSPGGVAPPPPQRGHARERRGVPRRDRWRDGDPHLLPAAVQDPHRIHAADPVRRALRGPQQAVRREGARFPRLDRGRPPPRGVLP